MHELLLAQSLRNVNNKQLSDLIMPGSRALYGHYRRLLRIKSLEHYYVLMLYSNIYKFIEIVFTQSVSIFNVVIYDFSGI